jgi:type IV pilus assembly PilX-like protein
MNEQANVNHPRNRREAGFALILAILALMLLTFLGLTLAATSSTELQIATNYRWSQQALYNAEAGMEAAKLILSAVADPINGWKNVLPGARTTPWPASTPPAPPTTGTGRDYENKNCTGDRGGVGYGLVLVDKSGIRYEDQNSFMSQPLNGNFSIWIRRGLVSQNDGLFSETDTDNTSVVVTAEGVAPYTGGGTTFTRANQAVRILEVRYSMSLQQVNNQCMGYSGQAGLGPTGENFDPCSVLVSGSGLTGLAGGGGTLTGLKDANGELIQ